MVLLKKISLYLNLLLFISTLFFNRALYGITIFDFRLGEILIAICLLFSLSFLIFKNRISEILVFRTAKISTIVLIIFGFTTLRIGFYVFQSGIVDKEFIRLSSFIWTLIFLYNFNKFPKLEKIKSIYLMVLLSIIYVVQFLNYPDFLIDLFNEYSDKIIFFKPADLFIGVSSIYALFHLKSRSSYRVLFLAMYLPIFLFVSRGSFLGFTVFGSILLFDMFKSISPKDILKISSLLIIIFILSSNLIVAAVASGNSSFNLIYAEETMIDESSLEILLKNKNSREIFSVFYDNGRLYSFDNNINWRLQIWQDEIRNNKNSLLFGQGFFKVMKSMKPDYRRGYDGKNIYPHNFFITIFSSGGIILMSLFLLLYFFLFSGSKNVYVKSILISGLLVSCFDVTMEGVQYPYIFYSTLGYLYHFTDSS